MSDVRHPEDSQPQKAINEAPGLLLSDCQYPSRGSVCPKCGLGKLNYNGLLILTCPECGYQAPGGAFT